MTLLSSQEQVCEDEGLKSSRPNVSDLGSYERDCMTAVELASQIGATFRNGVKCEVEGTSVACKLMIDHDPLAICRALKEAGIDGVVKGEDTIVFYVNPMFVCSAEECALALHYTVKRLKGLL